jgi:hypothetical protein
MRTEDEEMHAQLVREFQSGVHLLGQGLTHSLVVYGAKTEVAMETLIGLLFEAAVTEARDLNLDLPTLQQMLSDRWHEYIRRYG